MKAAIKVNLETNREWTPMDANEKIRNTHLL